MTADLERERLIWTMMRSFEELALERYERHVPALATAAKREAVRRLRAEAPDDAALEASALRDPVRELLALAGAGADGPATLVVQGLVLERLGWTIYARIRSEERASDGARGLAERGFAAAEEAVRAVPALLRERAIAGEALVEEFRRSARLVLARLDALGEGIDAAFGDAYRLRFADLMGEVAAELLDTCIELGANRRKLVCFLTSAMMTR